MPSRGWSARIGVAFLFLAIRGRSSTCDDDATLETSTDHSVSLLQHSLDLQGRSSGSLQANQTNDLAVWPTTTTVRTAETLQRQYKPALDALPGLLPNVSDYTLRALGFDLLAICVVILLINWWQSDSRNSQSSAAGARSALLDNAKVLGSCLVIYNHCMYNAVEAATGPIVPVSLLMNRHFSYLVNPTFVFVSGITSQGGPTVKRIRRYIQFLVIPTILFQTLVNPYFVQNLVDLKPSNIPDQIQHFQHDLWQKISHLPDWYLLSLCLWRGLTYAVWSHIPKYVSFPMMVFLSCAAGYIEFPDMMNPFFSYMPIFGFGYCFPLAAMERAVPKPNQIVSACVLVMVGVWVSVIMPGLFPAPPGSDPFTGVLPDSHNWYGEADAQFETALPWDYALWWSRRLTKLFADMVSPLSLIFFVLPRQETFLTYAGQHTLYSYLTQRVLFSWREKIFLLLPVWDQQHHVIYLTGFIGQCLKEVIYIPFTIFVFVVVTSSYWRPIFSWGLSPKWMDPYMDRIESSVSNMLGYDELGKEKQRSGATPVSEDASGKLLAGEALLAAK